MEVPWRCRPSGVLEEGDPGGIGTPGGVGTPKVFSTQGRGTREVYFAPFGVLDKYPGGIMGTGT